jgi:hypothetical protein
VTIQPTAREALPGQEHQIDLLNSAVPATLAAMKASWNLGLEWVEQGGQVQYFDQNSPDAL